MALNSTTTAKENSCLVEANDYFETVTVSRIKNSHLIHHFWDDGWAQNNGEVREYSSDSNDLSSNRDDTPLTVWMLEINEAQPRRTSVPRPRLRAVLSPGQDFCVPFTACSDRFATPSGYLPKRCGRWREARPCEADLRGKHSHLTGQWTSIDLYRGDLRAAMLGRWPARPICSRCFRDCPPPMIQPQWAAGKLAQHPAGTSKSIPTIPLRPLQL